MKSRAPFAGSIARTVQESTPHWPKPTTPDATAPNIVVVVLDDTGWSDLGCFGSEISTPTFDTLAADGLRFNNFHVTPLCSPTRASLLTGLNHHRAGMRFLALADTGFPNCRGELDPEVTTVVQRLQETGYGTYLSGKWHLAPQSECSPAGPFHNWPLGKGFNRFYGFLGGAMDHYCPELIQDNTAVPRPAREDYHLTSDLVDHAIGFAHDHVAFRPDTPFFLQLSLGATHAPFQAPASFRAKYRGVYEAGWDAIRERRRQRQFDLGVVPEGTQAAPRNDDVPAWDDLTADEQQVAAAGQQAFAGFLDHADAEVGRLVDALRSMDRLDNTMFVLFSDNGAAGDGGRRGTSSVISPYNALTTDTAWEVEQADRFGDADHPAHYATGWAMTGNTPFRLYKEYTDLGGIRSPLVIRYPDATAAPGAVRSQFCHVTDLSATIAQAAGLDDVADLDGASLGPVLRDGDACAPRDTQYFEIVGHRGIWHQGFKAVTTHTSGTAYEDDTWRLYDTENDFAEVDDLAPQQPERLEQMKQLWDDEAKRNDVFPLDDRSLKTMIREVDQTGSAPRTVILRPGQSHVPFTSRLTGTGRSFEATARLRGRRNGDDGVIFASGASYGGHSLFILDGELHWEHLLLGTRTQLTADRPMPVGDCDVRLRLRVGDDRSAVVTLLIDDQQVGTARVPMTAAQPAMYGMDIGQDLTSAVSDRYRDRLPFPLRPAVLERVELAFTPHVPDETDALNLEVNQ